MDTDIMTLIRRRCTTSIQEICAMVETFQFLAEEAEAERTQADLLHMDHMIVDIIEDTKLSVMIITSTSVVTTTTTTSTTTMI